MNIYLMELLSKWISVITLSLATSFGVVDNTENNILVVENTNQTKDSVAKTETIPYQKEIVYNDKEPEGNKKTIQKGELGVAYVINGEKEIIKRPITEKVEIGTKIQAVFTGKMTGYGADCEGCSGKGNLSCKTKNGKTYSLIRDGANYKDSEFGNLRILAASLDKFPCGTVIKVTHKNFGVFDAIVLDTGSAMRNAWSKGQVLMDLAFVTQKDSKINLSTAKNTKYEVKRWGW